MSAVLIVLIAAIAIGMKIAIVKLMIDSRRDHL